MLSETQDTRYFERMASSLGDKRQLLDHLKGDRILDVGAGGGELAEAIRATGKDVWALDGSHAATRRMAENFPKLNLLTGLAHEVGYLAPNEHFSTVVCSSIFHEVYSYGTPETGPYSVEALRLTLKALYDSLEDGGRLVIRDGIMPTNWDQEVLVKFKQEDGPRFWETYRRNAPFASWHGKGQRVVHLEETDDPTVYSGNMESAMELLYTYTWGWQSSEREMKELYGVFTEDAYRKFVEEAGFTVESSRQYLQNGYPEFLEPKAEILNSKGEKLPWPSSNFILVAHKA